VSAPEERSANLRLRSNVITASPNIYIADTLNNRIRVVDSSSNMTTSAGNGLGKFAGDGGAATSASVKVPDGVAVDAAGNTYIADTQNNRIRKVDAASGKISTYAGNGSATFSGDGGPATAAGLNNPTGVAVDSVGNLFIADQRNNRVRMVDTTGTITTVAGNGTVGYSGDGGSPTSAQLYYPTAVAWGLNGGVDPLLFIADTNNHTVRYVIDGFIFSTAGTGQVGYGCTNGGYGLHSPTGVAFDTPLQMLFIADYGNNCVRSEQTAGAPLTTVAGTGIPGYGGDGGPGPNAALNYPAGVAVDTLHNVFIADYANYRIRKVAGGIISTLAGTGAAGFNGDGGAATTEKLYQPFSVAVGPVPGP